MNKKEILGLCEFLKLHGYENTDNISKFIFGLQQENKILKENEENNDKVVDKVNWENMLLKKENKQLKDELKNKPDTQITLQDDKGNKFMIIQTERIDMQVELNKTIEKLFNNWNKLKKYINEANEDLYYTNNYDDILYIMQELEQGSDSNAKK